MTTEINTNQEVPFTQKDRELILQTWQAIMEMRNAIAAFQTELMPKLAQSPLGGMLGL